MKIINNVGEGYMPVSDYFSGMRLEAWKLKYTLENDRLKYYWADPVNGKGVIYRMIDEYENDLPYDFKNIQFKRYKITSFAKKTELVGKYYGLNDLEGTVLPDTAIIAAYDFIWAYTFTTKVASNGSYIETTTLNKYIGINDENRTPYCSKNTFGDTNRYLFDLLDEYNSYVLGNNVIYSEIDLIDEENPVYMYLPVSNTIGNDFYNNTIGVFFDNNTIGARFNNNTIGDYFYSNTIGDRVSSNTIGDRVSSNTIGVFFDNNTIGNDFRYNTIGNSFSDNTIGNDFNSNTIGNSFCYNTIKNYFYYNTVGNSVMYIMFLLDGTYQNQIRYLYLKNGLSGASAVNRLELYYSGLYNRTYTTTFELIANGNVISSWEAAPLVRAGKVKAFKTTASWSDTLDVIGDIKSALDAILGV